MNSVSRQQNAPTDAIISSYQTIAAALIKALERTIRDRDAERARRRELEERLRQIERAA
jgi:hypothetical protein